MTDNKTKRSPSNANKALLVPHIAKYKSLAKKAVNLAFDSYATNDAYNSVLENDPKLLELQDLVIKLSQAIQNVAVQYKTPAKASSKPQASESK